ncbi:class I SAM-dependent methyltransferase [Candidatus Gracilibacteria bacterium]|jgi:hypothetical protein|nr:class I SAM-dependent methyltransferase [Candidatus Gracilibacteria bacterium]
MKKRVEELLKQYRMGNILDDCGGVNLLIGLKQMIEENLNNDSIICEIGSYEGKSSEMFAIFCKEIYCIDVFTNNAVEETFDKMLQNYDNIKKIKNSSINAAELFSDHFFDCVYIDANHDYNSVKQDILLWRNKVKFGGFLSGHDYHYGAGGVYEALQELYKYTEIEIYQDSSWILKLN